MRAWHHATTLAERRAGARLRDDERRLGQRVSSRVPVDSERGAVIEP